MNAEIIVSAKLLFKDIVIDERLQFNNEFENQLFETGVFCYVPHMAQMHREMWTEEQLLIFYISNDVSTSVCRRAGKRGKIIFEPVKSMHEIPEKFELIVDIAGHGLPLPERLLPEYYFIDPKHFKRVLDLLIFS